MRPFSSSSICGCVSADTVLAGKGLQNVRAVCLLRVEVQQMIHVAVRRMLHLVDYISVHCHVRPVTDDDLILFDYLHGRVRRRAAE